jgi:hypothetical protein
VTVNVLEETENAYMLYHYIIQVYSFGLDVNEILGHLMNNLSHSLVIIHCTHNLQVSLFYSQTIKLTLSIESFLNSLTACSDSVAKHCTDYSFIRKLLDKHFLTRIHNTNTCTCM